MPASFRDLSGEQMQIHEITRKPLNEGPFLSGLYTGMQSALSKVGVQGPALAPPPNAKAGPAMNDIQASALAVKQAQTLKPLMQKSWGQAVQKIMSTSKDSAGIPITSLNQLNPAEMDNLEAQLVGLINTNIGLRGSYIQLPNMTNNEQAKKGATEIVIGIDTAKDAILKAAKDGTDAGTAWNNLMTGVGQAMTFQAFDTGSGGDIDIRVKRGSMPPTFEINFGNGSYVDFNKNDPKHAEVATMLGMKAP
jgi:hypothetical protein